MAAKKKAGAPSKKAAAKPRERETRAKAGRPTAYRAEHAKQARMLAERGATDREIGEFLGVSDRTIRAWKHKHPEFDEALRIGKDAADDRVERALYQRAVGYSFDAQKIMQYEGDPVVVDYVQHVPPDIQAAMYWLNNRRGYQWKSKVDHQHSGKVTLEQLVAGEE